MATHHTMDQTLLVRTAYCDIFCISVTLHWHHVLCLKKHLLFVGSLMQTHHCVAMSSTWRYYPSSNTNTQTHTCAFNSCFTPPSFSMLDDALRCFLSWSSNCDLNKRCGGGGGGGEGDRRCKGKGREKQTKQKALAGFFFVA